MRIMPTNAFKAFLNFVNIPQTLLSGNSLRDFYSTKCKGEHRPSVRREYRRGPYRIEKVHLFHKRPAHRQLIVRHLPPAGQQAVFRGELAAHG